jgi:hypothetical protein
MAGEIVNLMAIDVDRYQQITQQVSKIAKNEFQKSNKFL